MRCQQREEQSLGLMDKIIEAIEWITENDATKCEVTVSTFLLGVRRATKVEYGPVNIDLAIKFAKEKIVSCYIYELKDYLPLKHSHVEIEDGTYQVVHIKIDYEETK